MSAEQVTLGRWSLTLSASCGGCLNVHDLETLSKRRGSEILKSGGWTFNKKRGWRCQRCSHEEECQACQEWREKTSRSPCPEWWNLAIG